MWAQTHASYGYTCRCICDLIQCDLSDAFIQNSGWTCTKQWTNQETEDHFILKTKPYPDISPSAKDEHCMGYFKADSYTWSSLTWMDVANIHVVWAGGEISHCLLYMHTFLQSHLVAIWNTTSTLKKCEMIFVLNCIQSRWAYFNSGTFFFFFFFDLEL